MDGWGIAIFIVGAVLYVVLKRKPVFLFVCGVGVGLFVGAIWAGVAVFTGIK
jgi:hypothetical protein